ncbi:hypothetical protein USDA257_c16890 [Sinorhizobium fredii USDA 257]|uniref:Uncharacterized protein n=1 Tax=Sinorhizobium fredii (strain USDA 257) TaxID=1185652 RepID=I3X321_SINF2|nr:hypothetical protein USDA257_c16890 [Sinorhizobium fredii USDA 257]
MGGKTLVGGFPPLVRTLRRLRPFRAPTAISESSFELHARTLCSAIGRKRDQRALTAAKLPFAVRNTTRVLAHAKNQTLCCNAEFFC